MTNKRIVLCCTVAAAFTAVLLPAHAQRATELYTPIGQSPGLSEKLTVIGTIESVDEAERSFRISGPEPASAIVTERTQIYLDRSKLRETNRYGDRGDLKEGRRVEVLYEDREAIGQGPAEWIKIEMAEPED